MHLIREMFKNIKWEEMKTPEIEYKWYKHCIYRDKRKNMRRQKVKVIINDILHVEVTRKMQQKFIIINQTSFYMSCNNRK